ncbi:NapC/NirT cytochrome c domain-containing protein [Thermincola ferriacetica]|uniref:NapC/NirT cytochrome c domain-containing protein n=1 Tax=Thermincola ferriacetica TaxID=281456 RepID=A0A0L6W5A5_9FIRM|nr:NapC/NirT family cytochrome c [Thermincola ferriacetica]KNZ70543.1 NapC/NirT cytochrome c domain-containing protein [Thermincola ferriacetica]
MGFNIKTFHKLIKVLLVLLFLLGTAAAIASRAWTANIPSKMCGACHMMKPEYYTWLASSHAKVNCISCHIPPGPGPFIKANITGVKHFFKMATKSYVAPIIKLGPMSDAACERCHNMENRIVTTSEDLIIPHGKHKKQKVNCSKCHQGITHGNIAKRKITYEGDYQRWNATLGQSLMKNNAEYVRPDMDLCMRCHQLRKVTVACDACHKNGMKPADHLKGNFRNGGHGKIAAGDLGYCDSCHSYMSEKKIETLKEPEKYLQYLGGDKNQNNSLSVITYSRENTWCKACHQKRPPSHNEAMFIEKHGQMAQKDKQRCYTCHDNQGPQGPKGQGGPNTVANISCNECHPSIHRSKKFYHPFELPPNGKVDESCYTCHSQESCGRCHGKIQKRAN